MAIHIYECSKNREHRHEFVERATEEKYAGNPCGYDDCGGVLVLSAAVTTAPPKFRKGVGGFYAPTTSE